MLKNIQSFCIFKNKQRSPKGSAITEATAGLLILVPVSLLIVDLVALVIGQTINDDIAKQSARAAASWSTAAPAQAQIDAYIASSQYAGAGSGFVGGLQLTRFDWNPVLGVVTVGTQITIHLPIPVPFGGPSTQVMVTQFTEPLVGVPPTVANPIN